jgi:hypothetical protein
MKTVCLTFIVAAVCVTAQAGEITGKVTAGKGISVVYVEAIRGKNVSRLRQKPARDGSEVAVCFSRTFWRCSWAPRWNS